MFQLDQQSSFETLELECFKLTTLGRGYDFVPRTAAADERLRIVDEMLPQSTDARVGPMIGVLCARLRVSLDIVVCGVSKFPTLDEFGRKGVTLTHCILLRAADATRDARTAASVILTMVEQYENPQVYDFTGELLGRIAGSEPPPHYPAEVQDKRLADILRLRPDAVAAAGLRLDALGFDRLVEGYALPERSRRINIKSSFPFSKHAAFCVASASLLSRGDAFVAILGKPRQGIGADLVSTTAHVHGYEPIDFSCLIGLASREPEGSEFRRAATIGEPPIDAARAVPVQELQSTTSTPKSRPDHSAAVTPQRVLHTIVLLQVPLLVALFVLILGGFLVLHRLSLLSLDLRALDPSHTSSTDGVPDKAVTMGFPNAEDQRIYNKLVGGAEIVVDHLPSGWSIPGEDTTAEFLRRLGRVLSRTGVRARIEVHTDLAGGIEVNLDVAARRARAIEVLLTQGGVLAPGQVQVIPVGKAHPVRMSETTEADRIANRRLVVSKIS